MEFTELEIKGIFVITPKPNFDERGFFMRTFDVELFKKHNLNNIWVQENHSRSEKKGVLRGLHFQREPFSECKLVRCIKGEIFDVAVDLRANSPTFGKWVGIILSEQNRKMFYIPRGFAHGFCTITEFSEVLYKVDNFYSPEHETGILWNDSDLAIDWPVTEPIISIKDGQNVTLREYMANQNTL